MKQEYNSLLDKIAPIGSNKEFTEEVLRKAAKMEKNQNVRKNGFKRPIVALCAAAVALTLGVTTAAAAGIIEFDKIFGGVIKAENEQLGDAIMGRAENVNYTISDEKYKIQLNGVTGNQNVLIANLEISCVDGTSIADSFVNPYDERYGFTALDTGKVDMYMERDNWVSNMNHYSINEAGNLEIDVELTSDLDISGKRVTLMGKHLYPIEPYFELLEANGISMWTSDELKWINRSMEEVTPDTSSVIYLPVEWTVEFEYYPSDDALNSIYRDDFAPENKIMLEYCIGEYIDEGKFVDIESEIISVDLKSTNGTVILKSYYENYIDKETNRTPDILIGDEGNPVKLIKNDDSEITAFVCGAWCNPDGNITLDLKYIRGNTDNWYHNSIAIDLSQIKAISINNYQYEIK